MILSDYKDLNSENLARLTLNLGNANVIKGQDIKKALPLIISFYLMYKLLFDV